MLFSKLNKRHKYVKSIAQLRQTVFKKLILNFESRIMTISQSNCLSTWV